MITPSVFLLQRAGVNSMGAKACTLQGLEERREEEAVVKERD